jgi:hypothetical protein
MTDTRSAVRVTQASTNDEAGSARRGQAERSEGLERIERAVCTRYVRLL